MRLRRALAILAISTIGPEVCSAKKKRKGADYYAILGIEEKGADQASIKKGYKQKALEYHPDKCELGTETCQAKFIEMSSAYEVLSDPEKKKIYDEHGEEGLKQDKEGGQTGESAKAMFRQFFGREPDGNVRIVNQGGMMRFFEEGEPGPQENIYDETDAMELSSDVWNAYIKERDEPWVVQFYKPNDDESVAVKDEYKKFASTFRDFLKVAVVNCRKQRDICSGASVDSFPAVRWFPDDKTQNPEVYEGTVAAKGLGKWASSMMIDNTTHLEDKHSLRKWLDGLQGSAVVLFSDKSSTPPMWKALSREFRNRANLAVVLNCDKNGVFKTPLQREYDVRIPQIVRLDAIDPIGKIAEKFELQMKKDVLNLWLMKVIAVGKKAGPVATFKEWSKERFEAGDCTKTDGQFCFLWLKAGADPKVEEAMKQLAHKYRTDPIKMMWANTELNPSTLEVFGLENAESESGDFFVGYRPKRGKYKVFEGQLEFAALDSFVDGVLNGPPLQGKAQPDRLEL